MNNGKRRITMIPPKPEMDLGKASRRQLRVAAYCRVSTDDEEQLTSYDAQKAYYTDKIMKNPDWTMAGIFADEGITGTSAQKRPEFLKMIRMCRKKKIDLILVKSISRFARNTVDCLNYIRALKNLGIAVIFEKENINTMDSDSEMIITMMGAFAQAESESISQNVRWGKRQAMREGRVNFQYKNFYGYERGEDGEPKIIPGEAEVVRRIYDSFLAGQSLRMIQEWLENEKIPSIQGRENWSIHTIQGILKNEKYCGDVLMQKTYISDCLSKKVIRNTGQLPMYLVENNHEGIVSRETYRAVQAEFARRSSRRSQNKKAVTGLSCFTSKYALSDRLICGECGSSYRRCTWTRKSGKKIMWRCSSRLDYGSKYCKSSPSIEEELLHRAILEAINSAMDEKPLLVQQLTNVIRLELSPDTEMDMTLAQIDNELADLEKEFQRLFQESRESHDFMQYSELFKSVNDRAAALKKQKADILEVQNENQAVNGRLRSVENILKDAPDQITEWDESFIRQVVETVKVLSEHEIVVCLRGGTEIHQEMV